jgi:hypothetical protein
MPIPLLARFPRLRVPFEPRPVIAAGTAERHPVLAGDIAELDEVVTPEFTRYDRTAVREQNAYRRHHLVLLCGSAVLSALGGVQALLPGQRWPGVVLTIVGVLLATSSRWARERGSLDAYLNARVRAERLRALYFRYLARAGAYAGEDRARALRRAVLAVRAGREPQ